MLCALTTLTSSHLHTLTPSHPAGYPNEGAAHVALGTVKNWLDNNADKVSVLSALVFTSLTRCLVAMVMCCAGGQDHLLCVPEDR